MLEIVGEIKLEERVRDILVRNRFTRIEEVLGQGREGVVYKAYRQEYGEVACAVKVFTNDQSGEARERVRAVTFRANRIQEGGKKPKHLAEVFEVSDDFIAMELIKGKSLFEEIVDRISTFYENELERSHAVDLFKRTLNFDPRIFSTKEVKDIALQVSSALSHLHSNGVVQGDVQFGNIVRRKDGVLKLVDYGSSSSRGEATLGTLLYQSPEKIKALEDGLEYVSKPTDDIYSLGLLIYHLSNGRPLIRPDEQDYSRLDANGRDEQRNLLKLRIVNQEFDPLEEKLSDKFLGKVAQRCAFENPVYRFKDGGVLHRKLLRHHIWEKSKPFVQGGLAIGILLTMYYCRNQYLDRTMVKIVWHGYDKDPKSNFDLCLTDERGNSIQRVTETKDDERDPVGIAGKDRDYIIYRLDGTIFSLDTLGNRKLIVATEDDEINFDVDPYGNIVFTKLTGDLDHLQRNVYYGSIYSTDLDRVQPLLSNIGNAKVRFGDEGMVVLIEKTDGIWAHNLGGEFNMKLLKPIEEKDGLFRITDGGDDKLAQLVNGQIRFVRDHKVYWIDPIEGILESSLKPNDLEVSLTIRRGRFYSTHGRFETFEGE